MAGDGPAVLDIEVDIQKLQDDSKLPSIIQILRAVRPSWSVENIRCKVFDEGISNALIGYFLEGKFKEDVVLIRIYGEGTDLMIDRGREKKVIQELSSRGFCAPLYCSFKNGIAYGFVQGVTLDTETVKEKRRLIAKEMSKMHAIKLDGGTPKSELFDKMKRFLDISPDHFEDKEKQTRYAATIKPKTQLQEEYKELTTHLGALGCSAVFSHNDLLLKNIIYTESPDKVTFIDFEYAMYSYHPFDIADHFCEYAGIDTVDYTMYPDKEYQLEWIKYYLECWAEQNGRPVSSVTDVEVEKWYVMVNKFALAAHFFWGLWALIQAEHSLIDFDFLGYAQIRFDEYFAKKDVFLGLKMPS